MRDWWNSDGRNYATPREHLFEQLGLKADVAANGLQKVGKGGGGLVARTSGALFRQCGAQHALSKSRKRQSGLLA